MKKIVFVLFTFLTIALRSQILFSDKFNTLSLQTFTNTSHSTSYTTVPTTYSYIDDIYTNFIGTFNSPNRPFEVPALKTKGWAVGFNTMDNDTFLISTSWLDSSGKTVDRWVITPTINNITANSILSWEGKAPDPNFPDGYEVYVTSATGTLTQSSFQTTDKVFSLADGNTVGAGERNVWTKHSVSLAAYAGQNVRVAFHNISRDMYQLWIDDITVENIANAFDGAMSMAPDPIGKYNTINTNGIVKCNITNKGNTAITGITLNYAISGFANQSESLSAPVPINTYDSNVFSFNTPYNISTPGYYKLKVWINSINGSADQDHSNDTIVTYLSIMASAPSKTVMVEQFLSAFDGNSVEGQEKLNGMLTPSVVAVNIHDGDSLKISSVNSLISSYRKKTSTAMFDRNYFYDINSVPVDRISYGTHLGQRLNAIVPATVSVSNISYNNLSRVVTFTVNANFVSEVQGDYRINAYITENTVYGDLNDITYNGWNQLNFMYNTPWSAYYQTGNFNTSANGYVLDASKFWHQHVLDAAPDGPYGVAGVIPTTGGTNGQTYSRAYSYTLPATPTPKARYNADNLYIVGFVAEYNSDINQRTVLNCAQEKVTTNPELVSVKELPVQNSLFSIYPNPSYGALSILIPEKSFSTQPSIKIVDVLGKEVYSQQAGLTFGLVQLNLDYLANGTYYISLGTENNISIKKLIIAR